jgi:hypothetical protein
MELMVQYRLFAEECRKLSARIAGDLPLLAHPNE